MNPIKEAQNNIRRWRHDPVAFVREVFCVDPDEWQADFLHAYNGNPRVAAKACKGPGKTTVLAWCCWHFLVCYPHPKIAATSITGDNLRDGLWTEMAKWMNKSAFLKAAFEWKAERISSRDHPETWYMSARKWSASADKNQQSNALAGLHADYIMFVIDEAGGVPDAVAAAAKAALANAGTEVNPNAIAKLLLCGNPTHLSGPLYRACTTEASNWKVIEITGDPNDPKRSPRISKKWAEDMIKEYGAEHPWVLVNVFGKFPPASFNALVGPDEVEAAMRRQTTGYEKMPKILGVDVARQGDDRSVIAPRQGLVYFKPKVLRLPRGDLVADVVSLAIEKWKPDAVFIDASGGYGWAVIEPLQQRGYAPIPVEFGGKSGNPQFLNKRSEMAFNFAHAIKHGGCLPPDQELKEEACAITYFHNARDKLQIIEKDQIKEELGRSPDLFDAYALTHAYPVAKRDPADDYRKPQQTRDYDPMKEMGMRPDQQSFADYNPLG